jgi:hypothetical protein
VVLTPFGEREEVDTHSGRNGRNGNDDHSGK